MSNVHIQTYLTRLVTGLKNVIMMLLELYVLNVKIFDLKSLSFWKNTLFFQ